MKNFDRKQRLIQKKEAAKDIWISKKEGLRKTKCCEEENISKNVDRRENAILQKALL